MRRAAPAASQHRGTPVVPGLVLRHDRKRKERITSRRDICSRSMRLEPDGGTPADDPVRGLMSGEDKQRLIDEVVST